MVAINENYKHNRLALNYMFESLSDIIVTYDEEDKIVFLPYENLNARINQMPMDRKNQVIKMFSLILGMCFFTPAQISDIQKIIENETYLRVPEIKDFIKTVDEYGMILLIPQNEFIEKFNKIERVELETVVDELTEIAINNLISEDYFITEWKSKDFFLRYVESKLQRVEKQEQLEWELEIKRYVRSDEPFENKINYITELLTDIIHANTENDTISGNNQRLLKSLLEELK